MSDVFVISTEKVCIIYLKFTKKIDTIKSHHTQGHIYNYVEMDMLFIT